MKTAIMYYYNMENPTIYRVQQKIYIKNNNHRYILQPIQSTEIVNEIFNIIENNDKIKKNCHKLLLTKDGNIYFFYKNLKFIVMEINKNSPQIESIIMDKTILPKNNYKLNRINWYFLWSKKIDYIYKQSTLIDRKYKIVNEPIDYYMGMAETAIIYLKNNTKQDFSSNNLSVCYNRISSEEIKNPLNIVVDTKERDISEYLKYLFIKEKQSIELTKKIINESKLTEEGYVRLYARMLFPTYFFDTYERIINNNENEDTILAIISRIDKYECYLREIYEEINKITILKKINWI